MSKYKLVKNSGEKKAKETNENEENNGVTKYLAFGLSIGMAVGMLLGSILGNMAMGTGLGMCAGVAVGTLIMGKKSSELEDEGK